MWIIIAVVAALAFGASFIAMVHAGEMIDHASRGDRSLLE